jgi:hypothetical protein
VTLLAMFVAEQEHWTDTRHSPRLSLAFLPATHK